MSGSYDSAKANREQNDNVPVATKENFWNYIERSCPKTFAKFKVWVDEYKVRVNWTNLLATYVDQDLPTKRKKLHEIPIAMQFGVFIQFTQELVDKKHDFSPDVRDMESFGQSIMEWCTQEEFPEINEFHV